MKDPLMHTLYAPAGADAFFALGLPGHGGGFALEQERVPQQDLFIGVRDGLDIRCLPFFRQAAASAMDSFVQREGEGKAHRLMAFAPEEVQRTLAYGTDCYAAGNVRFTFYTPVRAIPDPDAAAPGELKDAIAPAIVARLSVDNRAGEHDVEAVFAVAGQRGLSPLAEKTDGRLKGFSSYYGYGFAVAGSPDVEEFVDFGLERAYNRPCKFTLRVADTASLSLRVPAGRVGHMDIALGWFRGGNVLDGMHSGTYYYTRFFSDIREVLSYALERACDWRQQAMENDALADSLSDARRQMVCQAARCYYASSMLFDVDGAPRWLVNEGTFRMMSTLDLLVDHAFFELRHHPWVLRNQLDSFLAEYSYEDQCGLTFCHDQGSHHVFSPFGHSSYEVHDLDDCFSYMSQEQLCNWALAAALYAEGAGDKGWALRNAKAFADCLDSMRRRDSLTGAYTGLMAVDSSRCCGGAEITTYDSLDTSLGQARQNLYVAVKRWAATLALGRLLALADRVKLAQEAHAYARLCADAVAARWDDNMGRLPALLDGSNPAAIIPAIEALVYPRFFGMEQALDPGGEYAALLGALRRHALSVIRPGVCLFPDGGWKLSATSDNSWISKIYLCEYVAQNILHLDLDYDACDRAHAAWWFVGCAGSPGIDQILAGQTPERGFHYPRCVTNTLWLESCVSPLLSV